MIPRPPLVSLGLAVLITLCSTAVAGEPSTTVRGIGIAAGTAYDPEVFPVVLTTAFVLLDYDSVFWHKAPDPLRLKLEGNLGTAVGDRKGLMASANALVSFTVDVGSMTVFPYGEAGIGLIYTDFRVDGQGSKFNFNPQAGLGLEFRGSGKPRGWLALRIHHISNGGLNDENRGVNSVLVSAGTMF
jgi:hypothetical protein